MLDGLGRGKIGICEASFKRSLQWGVLVMKVGIKAPVMGMVQGHVYDTQELDIIGSLGWLRNTAERGDNDGFRILNWVTRCFMVLTRRVRYIEALCFWLRWLGLGGPGGGERKVEVMSSVDRSVRQCAFEVFMRCLGGDVQQVAGYIIELPVISIVNVCRSRYTANRYVVQALIPSQSPVICLGIKSGACDLSLM